MKKKIIALILCICLISCTCIQPAYAIGAEGIIVGGGAAAAGVTLTMPQVALLVAAGFGLVYATQHAGEIYRGLDTALTNAATNVEGGIEQLSTWTAQAAQGDIAIASAPTWIVDSIKSWISELYQSSGTSSFSCSEFAPYEAIPTVNFWTNKTRTYPVPTTVLRAGVVRKGTTHYTLTSIMMVISELECTDLNLKLTYEDKTYYYQYYSSGGNPSATEELAGNNKIMYDGIAALPSKDYIDSTYTGSTEIKMLKAWQDGYLSAPSGSICPDATVGGIEGALDVAGIDNVNVPDMDIGDSQLLFPPHVLEGNSIDNLLNDILTRLKQHELSWSDFMTDVAVGNPSISIEGKDYVIDDTGVTDIPVEDVLPDNPPSNPPSVNVPEGLEPFTMSLTDFFPFCIPFDIADFVNVLCAEPEAPRFDWTFTWYGGDTDTLTIDLSPFNSVAQLLRNMELLLFCIGLALITRNQIRG